MKQQVIQQRYDKTILATLPIEAFKGKIVVINRISDVKKAVSYLMQQHILGFDTETKPSFRKGKTNKVALLQVATHDVAFLFQLNATGITDDIVKGEFRRGAGNFIDFFKQRFRGLQQRDIIAVHILYRAA